MHCTDHVAATRLAVKIWLSGDSLKETRSCLTADLCCGGYMGNIYRAYEQHCPHFQMSFVDTVSVDRLHLFLLIIVSCDFKIMTLVFFIHKEIFLIGRGGGDGWLVSHDL